MYTYIRGVYNQGGEVGIKQIMNKKLDWIGGTWLLINIPAIPFVGSILHQLPASLHLVLAVIVVIIFATLSKSFSASVIASLCVVAIVLLRLEQVQDYLQSAGVDSVTSSLILVIMIALIAVGVIVYKLIKGKR